MRAKHGVALTVLGLSLLELTGCRLTGEPSATADIVIAADLELSGTQAAVGAAYQRALRLEVDRLNASGALGKRNVRLVIRDNQGDPNVSVVNIAEFTRESDLAGIIAGPCTVCLLASAKTVNTRRIPTIALTASDEVNEPVGERAYLFRVGPNANDNAAALVENLAGSGARTIGLITVDDAYGREGRQAMVEEARKAGITVTGQAATAPNSENVTDPVQTAIADGPDALVVWAYPAQASQIAMAARGAKYGGRLYFDAVAAGDLFLPGSSSQATDGATMVFTQILAIDDLIATTPAKAARKQWFSEYTAKYGSFHGYASFAADAVRLLTSAINNTSAENVDRKRVRDALETSQLDGLSGPIRITPVNHSALSSRALTTLVARNGRWRLVGAQTAAATATPTSSSSSGGNNGGGNNGSSNNGAGGNNGGSSSSPSSRRNQ